MTQTYRDSAKKLDNLFNDFMKKVNTQPSSSQQQLQQQVQSSQLKQSASQRLISNQNLQKSSTLSPYMNSSSLYTGTENPLSDNRTLMHSNSAYLLQSQQTGLSSNGTYPCPPLPYKQQSNPVSTRRKNSFSQLSQQQQQPSQLLLKSSVQENNDNQENMFEYDENAQYFQDTFQGQGSSIESNIQDKIQQIPQNKIQQVHQNVLKPVNLHHQVSFNQKSNTEGYDHNKIQTDVVNRVDELFPSVHQIIKGTTNNNSDNLYYQGSTANGTFINQNGQHQPQNSRQGFVFDTNQNQQLTYQSQMTSKRQATEGSLMMGYGTSISTTHKESKAYANAMKALQAKIRELQALLDAKDKDMKNEREQQQDNLFNLQTILSNKEEELRESRRQFEESEKQLKEMHVAFETGDAEKTEIFERMEQDLSLLNNQLNESRNKHSKLKEELLSEKSTRQNLEEDLTSVQQEAQEAKRSLHQLQVEHRLLQDEKDELNRKYSSERMAKEEFQIKSDSRQRDLSKMKEHYNEQLREFQNELNLLETNYSRKISDLEKRISILQEQNEEQKQLLEVKNTEIDQLQTQQYQKQNEWEETRVNLVTKQRKLVDQIHQLKQQKAQQNTSTSSSRHNLRDGMTNEEYILLSSVKSKSHKRDKSKSNSNNQEISKKSRNSSTSRSRSPTPQKQTKSNPSLPSFSNTTIAANSQKIHKNQSEQQQINSKEIQQNVIRSPISSQKSNKQQLNTNIQTNQIIYSQNTKTVSQSPPPHTSNINLLTQNRSNSQTLPSNIQHQQQQQYQLQQHQQQLQHHQQLQYQQQGSTGRVVVNQNNFDTPLFQNELLRDKSKQDINIVNQQNDQDQYSQDNTNYQQLYQQQQIVGQSTITQNDSEPDDKMASQNQAENSFFYNQYLQQASASSNNIQYNNSHVTNNSRLHVSQLNNNSQFQEQNQLNNSNNNVSYMQNQSTVNQITNMTTVTQGQEVNEKYEYILKQIIEAEKESISLSSQFQNILTESGKTEDSKKKHEYRGRLIELNEQINKNNQKLFGLKRKEQEVLDQIN